MKSWIKAIAIIAAGAVLAAILFDYGYGKAGMIIFGLTIIVPTIVTVNSCLTDKTKLMYRLLIFALIVDIPGGSTATAVIAFTPKYSAYQGAVFAGMIVLGAILCFCLCVFNQESEITVAH
ncbi:MAG: hypothetical protein Q8P20_02565 [bacterium]|nr:hypothetical protein [bacterium]